MLLIDFQSQLTSSRAEAEWIGCGDSCGVGATRTGVLWEEQASFRFRHARRLAGQCKMHLHWGASDIKPIPNPHSLDNLRTVHPDPPPPLHTYCPLPSHDVHCKCSEAHLQLKLPSGFRTGSCSHGPLRWGGGRWLVDRIGRTKGLVFVLCVANVQRPSTCNCICCLPSMRFNQSDFQCPQNFAKGHFGNFNDVILSSQERTRISRGFRPVEYIVVCTAKGLYNTASQIPKCVYRS